MHNLSYGTIMNQANLLMQSMILSHLFFVQCLHVQMIYRLYMFLLQTPVIQQYLLQIPVKSWRSCNLQTKYQVQEDIDNDIAIAVLWAFTNMDDIRRWISKEQQQIFKLSGAGVFINCHRHSIVNCKCCGKGVLKVKCPFALKRLARWQWWSGRFLLVTNGHKRENTPASNKFSC